MAAEYKAFNAYKIWYYAKSPMDAQIQCYFNAQYVGSLVFHREIIPDNSLDDDGHIRLHFSFEEFDRVLDLLRNEKPLFLWLNPPNLIGGIATDDLEPVGEGE